MVREQEMLLEELAAFINMVEGRTDLSLDDARTWTLQQWVDTIFPVSTWY